MALVGEDKEKKKSMTLGVNWRENKDREKDVEEKEKSVDEALENYVQREIW